MLISSSAFEENEDIPVEYTCDGEGMSPPLSFEDVPEEARSLTLVVDDPDAPAGTFTHWVLWNINPDVEEIEEGEVPPGARQGVNSSGGTGYTPPCPLSGVHRYIFNLYALDKTLDLPSSSSKEELEEEMGGSIIAQTSLTGLYGHMDDDGGLQDSGDFGI